ncbi:MULTISPECIES: hypothetical protein [unclassified Halomonas]|uniref:hypothetical protein n=1 Tax=unclassified Halomonas TaxID=2609666 RepID=UPI001EF66965|nr:MULTISPECIES: hypothetical protein [unclassified Halomonas]MCG7589698.1 hypothetical protein [Halomonas sp. McD50-5]MCG7616253.1 hypothetical protein [Halomonas sp. McD50-4]
MPLSNVERQVLALITDEHRQTRRGAKTAIVHVGMNAANSQQKARIVDVLLALKKRGLVVFGDEAWLPTTEGEGALWSSASKAVEIASEERQEAKPVCVKCKGKLCEMEAEQYGDICNDCFKDMEAAPIAVEPIGQPAPLLPLPFDVAHLLTSERAPDDLLNRCAAMNATLMAQAKQAYEQGEPDAWRDLHWLMETAQQLVALGGES